MRFCPLSLVSKSLSGQHPGGRAGGIKSSQKRYRKGDSSHNHSVGPARSEGQIVNGVDLGGEMNEVVVAPDPGKTVPGDQAQNGP